MYVERNEAGRIVGAWEESQSEAQELVPIDDADLQAFLVTPVGRWDVPGGDGGRWGEATLRMIGLEVALSAADGLQPDRARPPN